MGFEGGGEGIGRKGGKGIESIENKNLFLFLYYKRKSQAQRIAHLAGNPQGPCFSLSGSSIPGPGLAPAPVPAPAPA